MVLLLLRTRSFRCGLSEGSERGAELGHEQIGLLRGGMAASVDLSQ
jgi:hypothetical protein